MTTIISGILRMSRDELETETVRSDGDGRVIQERGAADRRKKRPAFRGANHRCGRDNSYTATDGCMRMANRVV
jgi:hypothetical protein